VPNLKGDAARAQFISLFKEVQRLKTQLDQYTDLEPEQKIQIEAIIPPDTQQSFRAHYLETARQLREKQSQDTAPPEVQQLDFEFVLFASAVIDYDYIMALIARLTGQKPGKLTLNREQLIGLIQSDAKFLDERDASPTTSAACRRERSTNAIRAGFERFKAEKKARELAELAARHGLPASALQAFVDEVLRRRHLRRRAPV